MAKKVTLFFIIVLILIAGGFFWWQNQEDVRELNANLPEGVRVVKSLIGDEYSVINKIDGYEFKVPEEWEGIEEIEYFPQAIEQGYSGSSVGLKGKEGAGRIITLVQFQIDELDIDLESWVKTYFENSGVVNNFNKETIGAFEVVRTQKFDISLLGYAFFFKKDFVIYGIAGGSEEFIREIITNGKW